MIYTVPIISFVTIFWQFRFHRSSSLVPSSHYPYQPSPEKWQSNRAVDEEENDVWRTVCGQPSGRHPISSTVYHGCSTRSFLPVFPRAFSRSATTISRWDFIHSRTCAIPARKAICSSSWKGQRSRSRYINIHIYIYIYIYIISSYISYIYLIQK